MMIIRAGLLAFLGISSAWASPEFVLVSDLDDTAKVTNVRSRAEMIKNALFSRDAFAGMAPLYRQMVGLNDDIQEEHDFYVLSGSPRQLRGRVSSFLRKHRFPKSAVILKNWFRQRDTFDYKLAALERIASETSAPLILVGDDTEHDHDVYAEFNRTHPGRVLAMYVRQVVGRQLPEGIVPFYSAFDVAFHEANAGRLSFDQALEVADAVLGAREREHVIPDFAACPRQSPVVLPEKTDLEIVLSTVYRRILELCSGRRSMRVSAPVAEAVAGN